MVYFFLWTKLQYWFFLLFFRKIGFYGIFSLSATLYFIAFCYGLFFLKEVPQTNAQRMLVKKKNILADFFDRKHVVETFEVAFKKGHNQRRKRVIMLMIVVMVVIGPMHGKLILSL